jgi:hypothetical protein
MVTTEWHRARKALSIPFGYNASELCADGFEVGEARTMAVEKARASGAEWIFFNDYDTLIPPNALKQLMYRAATHPEYDVYAGVYCVKEHPAIPIIYKNWGEGPCWDWTIGDVIPDVVGVPMGCTLLRLSSFDRLTNTPEMPWFKTCDLSNGNPLDSENNYAAVQGTITEDLWFCKRAVEEAKFRLLVDTGIQCGHISHSTGEIFALPPDSPPVKRWEEKHGRRLNDDQNK